MKKELEIVGRQTLFDKEVAIYGTLENPLFVEFKKGVMFRQSNSWMLTADYSIKGYTKTRTFTYLKGVGEVGTKIITVWTERGRVFLNKMFNRYKSSNL